MRLILLRHQERFEDPTLLTELTDIGKQNAIWKFNTNYFSEELIKEFDLSLFDFIPVGAKALPHQTEEQASNIFSIMVFSRNY